MSVIRPTSERYGPALSGAPEYLLIKRDDYRTGASYKRDVERSTHDPATTFAEYHSDYARSKAVLSSELGRTG